MNATIFVSYIRTSCPEVFGKKIVFKNFQKFTENTCAGVCLFNKVEDITPNTSVFFGEFCKIS